MENYKIRLQLRQQERQEQQKQKQQRQQQQQQRQQQRQRQWQQLQQQQYEQEHEQQQQQQQEQQEEQQQYDDIIFNPTQHRYQGASGKVSSDEKLFYEKNLWKSQSLVPNDKISTKSYNNISLYDLLAGVLIRECIKNYSLELSNIPLEYLKLIISNIIRQNNINWNIKTWNKFRLWFNQNNKIPKQIQKTRIQKILRKKWNILLEDNPFQIEDGFFMIENNLTISELNLKDLAKSKYRSTRQNNEFAKNLYNNHGLNSIKPVFKTPQAFQIKEYTNNNKNDQRRDS
ncbi:16578_t:CDS:2, partial [Dentiscutata erythropus]